KACVPGERCSARSCLCDSNLMCGGQCVSTSDNANCGACGKTCPGSQYCSSSACRCQGYGLTACGDSCVNVLTDTAHCGSCTVACRPGEGCNSGVCGCP